MRNIVIASLLSLLLITKAASQLNVTATIDDGDSNPNDGMSRSGAVITVKCSYSESFARSIEPNMYFVGSDGMQQHIATDVANQGERWSNETAYKVKSNYSARPEYVQLTIKSASAIDIGKYKCTLKDTKNDADISSDEVELKEVLENTHSLELQGVVDGDLTVKSGQQTVTCKAFGGSGPTMNLIIGSATQTLDSITLGMVGERPVHTGSWIVDFMREMGTGPIKCTSVVEGFDMITDEAELEITAPPSIECDVDKIEADFKANQIYTVTCNATANPPPALDGIFWKTDRTSKPIQANEDRELIGYSSSAQSLPGWGYMITLSVTVQSDSTVPQYVELNVVAGVSALPKRITFTKAAISPSGTASSTASCLALLITSILPTIFH